MIEEINPQNSRRFNISPKLKKVLIFALPIVVLALFIYGLVAQGIIGSATNTTVTVKVVDTNSTAIENAQLVIEDNFAYTNSTGVATLSAKTGNKNIVVKKTGYIQFSKQYELIKGGNDLGTITLEESQDAKVDVQINVVSFISGEALGLAKVTLNDLIAKSTGNSYFFQKVPLGTYELKVKADGYNEYSRSVAITKDSSSLDKAELVNEGRIIYEDNKELGRGAIYSANLDGSDVKLLVPSVSNTHDYRPSVSSNQEYFYFFSTRDGELNNNGSAVEYLYFAKNDGSDVTKIAKLRSIEVVKWSQDNNYIAFIDSQLDPSKSTTFVYNIKTKSLNKLTDRNATDIVLNGSYIATKDNGLMEYIIVSDLSGNNASTVAEGTFANLEITAQGNLRYAKLSGNNYTYYDYNFGNKISTKLTIAQPYPIYNSTIAPNKKTRAYISERSGKYNLYTSGLDGKDEKLISGSLNALGDIIWSKDSEYLVFTIAGAEENAKYVVSTNGGSPKKIIDYIRTTIGAFE